jgi:integrase
LGAVVYSSLPLTAALVIEVTFIPVTRAAVAVVTMSSTGQPRTLIARVAWARAVKLCSIRPADRPSVAKSARVVLSGMFGLAVRFGAANTNPVRDVGTIKMEPKSARALSPMSSAASRMPCGPQVVLNPANKVTPRQTLSEYCSAANLADVVTMFAATGARISEVLGIRWQDIDFTAKTVAITGKLNRIPGQGMIRESFAKTEAGVRVLPLPAFAITMLMGRQVAALGNLHDVVFPSALGTLRDPSAVHKQWRTARSCLKLDWVTSHTFRKTLATLLDAHPSR